MLRPSVSQCIRTKPREGVRLNFMERQRHSTTFFEDGNFDGLGFMRGDGVEDRNSGGCSTLKMNDDFLVGARHEETTGMVFNVWRSASDGAAGKKNPQSAEVRTSEVLQLEAGIRDRTRNVIIDSNLTSTVY